MTRRGRNDTENYLLGELFLTLDVVDSSVYDEPSKRESEPQADEGKADAKQIRRECQDQQRDSTLKVV